MNLLLITLVNAMAQHDRHDQLSTTWLLDTGIGYQSFAPKVSAHYEGENILCDNQCSKQKKKGSGYYDTLNNLVPCFNLRFSFLN